MNPNSIVPNFPPTNSRNDLMVNATLSSSMKEKIATAKKVVLVSIVKLAQMRGMEGNRGRWKEFLCVYDKKVGVSLSDPARRSTDALVAFLMTFSKEDDLKLFEKVMQSHSLPKIMEPNQKKSADTPEQRLVHLTGGHPQYPWHYSFPSHEDGWVVTQRSKKSKAMRSTAMVAVDCEMVLCEDGTDALVRVCVVDRNLKVKLDELVKPGKAVVDYRTEITGVSSKDLEGITCSLEDIQKSMMKLLSNETTLIGHSLNNDLQALKIDHARVIDTSLIFKYSNGSNFKRLSLNDLCKSILGYELRKEGVSHNCVDDACAAMKLVLAKIDGGINNDVPLVYNDVPETDTMKLLIHRIPISIPGNQLHEIIPGDFTVEVKANRKSGDKYLAFAVFKTQQDANQAFEDLDGNQEKDSSGRPQKLISFQLNSVVSGSLYVRKMVRDDQLASRKRSSQDEAPTEPKKLKTDQKPGEAEELKGTVGCSDQCDGHLKEIERLKNELSQRDEEISNLNKIVIALRRKQLGDI